MKITHRIIFLVVLALVGTGAVMAQRSTTTIDVHYGSDMFGSPFTFTANAPANARSWKISVAENAGKVIFTDEGAYWGTGGYVWSPDENVMLQSGIYYIFTLSFFDTNDATIKTKALRFYTAVQIFDNKTPLIFFNGNTVDYSDNIYDERGVSGILDFIASKANSEYRNMTILVRGHAAFVTDTVEKRKKEQIELLRLSNDRALKIIRKLNERNVDPRRISYEVLGGSEEISPDPERRWINRRVEVVFISSQGGNAAVRNRRVFYDDFKNSIDSVENNQSSDTVEQASVPPFQAEPIDNATGEITPQNDSSGADNANAFQDETKTASEWDEQPANTSAFKPGTQNTQNTRRRPPENNSNNFQAEYSTVIVPLPADTVVDPWPDTPILSRGKLTVSEMTAFVLYNAPALNSEYVRRIASYYVLEATRERINHDVAFAQMLLETHYLQFTGTVQKAQYNFAGIGTIDNNTEGNWFSTEQIGVRAHIQHLKGYATMQPLVGDLVDPRYPILQRYRLLGSAPMVSMLSGRWAGDPEYDSKILRTMRRMYDFANAWNTANYNE